MPLPPSCAMVPPHCRKRGGHDKIIAGWFVEGVRYGTFVFTSVWPTSVALLPFMAGTSAAFAGDPESKIAGRKAPLIGDTDGHQIVRRESTLHYRQFGS